MHWEVWLSIAVIALISLVGLFAPAISPYDPTRMETGLSYYPPAWYDTSPKRGLPDHLLGTDFFGRDILSRVIHGARAAMFLVLAAIPLAVLIGVVTGVMAGWSNHIIQTIFLRLTDVISAIPAFMFAVMVILALRGTPAGAIFGGLITLTLAFALINWVGLARLVYIAVLNIKSQAFMEASQSLGAGSGRLIFRHVLPHLAYLIIVWVINNIPAVILLEALMGYIGIQILQVFDGSSFQDLSWGGLILSGRTQLNRNPFILLVPTLFILAISMSFSTLGEYLQERLNPQFRSNNLV
jgi:ABC-type dipeptide/oligopeptide/nickel transport system permease subunit